VLSTEPPSLPARRACCARCQRPAVACLCAFIAPADNLVEVLVLQHPLEQQQAKGTARLLTLSLRHSRLVVGERFESDALQALLHHPSPAGAAIQPLLLYPLDAMPAKPAQTPPAFAPSPAGLRLVVLDGTWRKSRKMLALNPALQALPRLSLNTPPPSRYAVRRAEQAQQRSTLEATVLALQQLEGDATRYAPLWSGFDAMVARLALHARRYGPPVG
jgi:DTW domain-containing protein YfiP